MLGYPQHAAICRRGSEMGRAGGKEVVCPYRQRQVAAIALRAPCSGIKIKDDKHTQPPFSSIRLRHRLAHSCPSQLSLFTVFLHMVAPGSIYSSQSSCAGVLQQHSLFSRLFQSSCTQLLVATFAFATFLHNSCPLAVFAFAIASHTVAPGSFRFSQSFYTRLLLAVFDFRSLPAHGCFSSTRSPLAFFQPFCQCTQLLVATCAFATFSHTVALCSIRLCHHPTLSCPWQLLLFAVYKPLFSQSSRMRSLLTVFASCSFLARVLRQHSLFFRPLFGSLPAHSCLCQPSLFADFPSALHTSLFS